MISSYGAMGSLLLCWVLLLCFVAEYHGFASFPVGFKLITPLGLAIAVLICFGIGVQTSHGGPWDIDAILHCRRSFSKLS